MAKGYSARRGFSNGNGAAMRQQQMQQRLADMQAEMSKAQEEVEAKEFSSTAGGGVVTAVVSGKKEVLRLEIKPEAVDPEDLEMLQDLVISAVNGALRQAEEAMDQGMGSLLGGLGGLPGLNL
mgnify:FL=1